MKQSLDKFAKSIVIDGAKNVGMFMLDILFTVLVFALLVACLAGAVYIIGFLTNCIIWIFHDGAKFGIKVCCAWGMILVVPIAVTIFAIKGLIELKKWLTDKWYLSAGCIKVHTNFPDQFEVGDRVWTHPHNSVGKDRPCGLALLSCHANFETCECTIEKIDYDTGRDCSWPARLFICPVNRK